MAYVRMDKDLADDWRVLALVDALLEEWISIGVAPQNRVFFRGAACNAVIGGIYRLWRYADTHLRRYDRLNLALHGVAEVTLLPVGVLRKFPPDWLIEREDGTVELPGYTAKNALIDKDNRREKTRERVRRWRERQREQLSAKNGHSGNALKRYEPITTGTGTGPGTGTGTTVTGTGPGPALQSRENPAPPGGERASAEGRRARRETPPEEIERRRRDAAAIADRLAAAKP